MEDLTLTGDGPSVAETLERVLAPIDGELAPVELILWLIVLASVALDVYTTALGLSAGLVEGNPIMRWAIDGLGFGALVAAKVLVVGGAWALRAVRPGYGGIIALGLAVPWTVTVAVNTVVLVTL